MPFVLILVAVLLWSWVGWWLLAIVLGVGVMAVFLLVSQSSNQTSSSIPSQKIGLAKPACTGAPIARDHAQRYDATDAGTRSEHGDHGRSADAGLITALVIKDRPLDMILAGTKKWEMRAQHTRKRETIALARKGSGQIFAVADIVDSLGPLSDTEMQSAFTKHRIDASRLALPEVSKYRYAWVLENVRRLHVPVPYEHRRGAQSFVTLDLDTSYAVRSSIMS